MKKIVLAVSALMFLTACDPFEGILSVKESFVVKSTDKDKVEQVALPAGDQSAKFEFPSKTEIQIKLKINDKKKTLKLVLPKKLAIPENGSFSIAAADLGQEFGANGTAQTRVDYSPIYTGYESCTYQRRETHCYLTPKGQVCQDRWYTVHGRRFIEYQDRNTDQSIHVGFQRDAAVLATFAGQRAYSERLVRHQGACY